VIAYVVALSDADEAIELIKKQVGIPGDRVEDIAPVSDVLPAALRLRRGDFKRA